MKKTRDSRRIPKLGIKSKGRLVRHPAGSFWLELLLQVRTHVEIAGARAPAKPLYRPSGCEIHVELFDAERYSAGGLISIEHDHCAHLMSALSDCFGVLQKSTFEQYVGKGNEQRFFVDCLEKTLKRNSYAVI